MKVASIHSRLNKLLELPETEILPSLSDESINWRESPPVLLNYQKEWVADESQVKIAEKSRRIGLTWAEACASVLAAAKAHGMNTIYVSYNFDMTENFIKDCAFWARHFELAATEIEEVVLKDGDRDILTYQIRFASGFTIKALSGKPNNIRGKQARVVIDEAAFCDDLDELLKAAIALLIWGGQIRIISTHNGVDNSFNKLVGEVIEGLRPYSHHKVTLDDALADGLYQRICLVQDKEWTLEGEFEWRKQLYLQYGVTASEELDCVPFKAESGKLFNRAWFEIVDVVPRHADEVRFWDFAATAKEVARSTSFYSASQKWCKVDDTYYILSCFWEQVGAGDADDSVVKIAHQDGRSCKVRWELEGGSAAIRYEDHLKKRLSNFDAEGVKPLGDKVTRAIPWASEAKRGNVKLVRGNWNDQFLDAIHAFDGTAKPLVNDIVDSGSGAYSEMLAPKSALAYY